MKPMKQFAKWVLPLVSAWMAFTSSQVVHAAQIAVGQVAPLSGSNASQGRAYAAGMQLFFNAINRAGGVNGHTFSLVSKDDGGRSEDTVKLTRQLLAGAQPMVLAGYFGGSNISELINTGTLEKEKIVLVGYHAADIGLESPQLYNVRASLRDELGAMSTHLATIGVTRLGLLYEEGSGATALVSAVDEIVRKSNGSIVSKASYEAGTARVTDAIDTFIKDKPQAIILVCSGAAGARFIERYRAEGGVAQLFVHSGADMERVTKKISENRLAFVSSVMQGVAIAQVVPNPYFVSKLAKELSDAMTRDKADVPMSYVVMEGFIAAKVIVEAVRRQGFRPTREGMANALENIDNLDLGGYVVGFKRGMRDGSQRVELTIISSTGKIRQ